MTTGDLKVYALNTTSLMVTLTSLEDTLKIILLLASIGYTAHRWYLMSKKIKKMQNSTTDSFADFITEMETKNTHLHLEM